MRCSALWDTLRLDSPAKVLLHSLDENALQTAFSNRRPQFDRHSFAPSLSKNSLREWLLEALRAGQPEGLAGEPANHST